MVLSRVGYTSDAAPPTGILGKEPPREKLSLWCCIIAICRLVLSRSDLGPFAKTLIELGGTAPGTQHDQLDVTGDFSAGGAATAAGTSGSTFGEDLGLVTSHDEEGGAC